MSEPVEVKESSNLRNFRSASPTKLDRILRLTNFLNAAFLCVAGILTFTPVPSVKLLLILASIYVIAFSCLLCCFELHLGFIERVIYRDCGFMFRVYGRLLFFLFVGTLSFALGTVGIAAGCFTVLNILLNLAIMQFSPSYRQFREQQMAEYNKNYATIREAWGAEMQTLKKDVTKKVATEAINQTFNTGRNNNNTNHPLSADSVWERIFDEESGGYYYYNTKTKETSWDAPKNSRYDDRIY